MGQEGITPKLSPESWAYRLTHILNAVAGMDRFPVPVAELARSYSEQIYPDDPITLVQGAHLLGFDGALLKAPAGRKGWGIFYNTSIASAGRINFTLAHEFGHYLIHRAAYPQGLRCGEQDVVRWDPSYKQIEHQANVFAATLLMPLDDFRRQIEPRSKIDLDMISACADRYRVSLMAATLRWLQYTERRAVLVVARDGYILWSRASASALRSGAFFRTSGAPVEIPSAALAARGGNGRQTADLPPGVWFADACCEMTVFSEAYDFTLSLLQLDHTARGGTQFDALDEPVSELSDEVRSIWRD